MLKHFLFTPPGPLFTFFHPLLERLNSLGYYLDSFGFQQVWPMRDTDERLEGGESFPPAEPCSFCTVQPSFLVLCLIPQLCKLSIHEISIRNFIHPGSVTVWSWNCWAHPSLAPKMKPTLPLPLPTRAPEPPPYSHSGTSYLIPFPLLGFF